MIWSAVLPGAALRVLRTAAGRRALHVALLAGGLFLLGLLCGGRAQAADGATESSRDTVGQVLDIPARTDERPGAVLPDLRPVSEKVVRAVRDRVARPVGAAVRTVTEGVEGAEADLRTDVPPLRVLPDLTGLSDLSDLTDPSGPSDPSAPSDGVPGLTDVPDPTDGSGASSSSAASAVPEPRAEPAPPVAGASGGEASSDTTDSRAVDGAASPVRVVGYGPEPGAGAALTARARTHPAGTAYTEYAPARPAPTGDPDGALGTASGADQGTSRHGDTRAVTSPHRFTFRLVPGAPERTDAAGVREPHRDVPVSPA
ncbi:hypothetical protein ACN6LC_001361 [Streptomyces violaceoruber]|uniref:hypothetical protein n=1 Tax=Streptomyces TaxID=1883 RepID=UPI0004C5806E|nr:MULTISPECIES: hypothetical protein [Streptomyces]MDX3349821.1 hypothetical protein [Streptomyces sp. ME02-6979A]WTE19029.1 hypothetical protein OH747_15925 [Streptomyces anthocyanicus]